MTAVVADKGRRAWLSFKEGFGTPWEGWRYMRQRPGLWRHGIIPVILNLLITFVVLAGLVVVAIWFIPRTVALFPSGWWWVAVKALAVVALLVLAAGGALVTWFILGGVLCGYYYGELARAVELELGTPPTELCEIPLKAQVVDTIRNVLALVFANIGLLALHIIPLLGSLAAFVGGLYVDWIVFGSDTFDYPLALRGWRRDRKQAFIRAHRAHTLGLGAVTFVFSLVPIMGAVILTTAVTGAVLLHQRMTAGGHAGTSPAGHLPAEPNNRTS